MENVKKFADIHTHFIYGMDDGAQTLDDMKAMLDAAWSDNIGTIIATPHITPGVYPFNEDRFQRHLAEAKAYCQEKGYGIEILSGGELLYTPAFEGYLSIHELPTLSDSGYVLIEFSPTISYPEILKAIEMLEKYAYKPILAHIERYRALGGLNAFRLKKQVDVRYQVNCSTVIDGAGLLKNLQVQNWFRNQLIDFIASDSHDCDRRKTRVKEAYDIISKRYGIEYAEKLISFDECNQ